MGLRRYLRMPDLIQQLKLSEAATQRLEDKVERLSSNFQALDEKMNALLSTLPIAGGGSQKLIYQILNDERLKDLTLHARYLGNDINLRLNDSDINVYQQIFIDNEYNSVYLPDSAKEIIDLGANIGLSVLFFAERYPDAHITAVEPEKKNFELMAQNLHGYKDRVTLMLGAIWPYDGEVQLVDHDEREGYLGAWGERTQSTISNPSKAVKAYSLPSIMAYVNIDQIDILKIDIEGAEYDLFNDRYESWIDKVKLLIIETHDRFRPNSEAIVRHALRDFEELPKVGENLFFKNRNF